MAVRTLRRYGGSRVIVAAVVGVIVGVAALLSIFPGALVPLSWRSSSLSWSLRCWRSALDSSARRRARLPGLSGVINAMFRLLQLALLVSCLIAVGCAGGNGTLARGQGLEAAVPISKARAVTYAHAINLRPTDLPEMTSSSSERELSATPGDRRSSAEFIHCYGGVSPALRVAKIQSPEFSLGAGAQAQDIESRVEVWPTSQLAARNNATYNTPRARACFARSLEALHRRLNEEGAGLLKFGRFKTATVPIHLAGVSRSFLHTIAETRVRNGQVRLRIYHDTFTFLVGAVEVELVATGFSHPVPTPTEERLLASLVKRATTTQL
jgi:hypothetical protein